MAKADLRREAVLDRLADHVLAEGLGASSLRPLAEAAGTSDRMLLYYFKDKATLIAATLARVSARLGDHMQRVSGGAPRPPAALKAELFALCTGAELWPYMRVWLELAALAAKGDPLFQQVGAEIGRGYLAWIEAHLAIEDQQARETEAARLLVSLEGLLLLHGVGLGEVSRRAL